MAERDAKVRRLATDSEAAADGTTTGADGKSVYGAASGGASAGAGAGAGVAAGSSCFKPQTVSPAARDASGSSSREAGDGAAFEVQEKLSALKAASDGKVADALHIAGALTDLTALARRRKPLATMLLRKNAIRVMVTALSKRKDDPVVATAAHTAMWTVAERSGARYELLRGGDCSPAKSALHGLQKHLKSHGAAACTAALSLLAAAAKAHVALDSDGDLPDEIEHALSCEAAAQAAADAMAAYPGDDGVLVAGTECIAQCTRMADGFDLLKDVAERCLPGVLAALDRRYDDTANVSFCCKLIVAMVGDLGALGNGPAAFAAREVSARALAYAFSRRFSGAGAAAFDFKHMSSSDAKAAKLLCNAMGDIAFFCYPGENTARRAEAILQSSAVEVVAELLQEPSTSFAVARAAMRMVEGVTGKDVPQSDLARIGLTTAVLTALSRTQGAPSFVDDSDSSESESESESRDWYASWPAGAVVVPAFCALASLAGSRVHHPEFLEPGMVALIATSGLPPPLAVGKSSSRRYNDRRDISENAVQTLYDLACGNARNVQLIKREVPDIEAKVTAWLPVMSECGREDARLLLKFLGAASTDVAETSAGGRSTAAASGSAGSSAKPE